MTREELLSMLDIAPEQITPGADDGTQGTTPTIPASPTALRLDDWSIRQGREAIESGEVLPPILADMDTDQAALAAADFLGAAFEPNPELAERCADETRGQYMTQLMGTEQYAALHADTQLDPLASELAAGHFAQGYVALIKQSEEEPDPKPGESPGPGGDLRSDMKALAAAAQALAGAEKEVGDLRDAQTAMGLGGDGAIPGSSMPLDQMRERFAKIRNSRTLRRIMELAGRYRRMAQARQRQKTSHGRDDVVGVELGADLGRLCPAELGALVDDDLEWDALRRYLERGMMQRDYRAVEKIGQGPIVVVVDESGSMSGEPIATAKAFALAMAWIAKYQRRWICLVGFSGDCDINALAMPPDKWDQAAILEWLEHFYSGGSDRDVPLAELAAAWESFGCPAGKTDIIQITDAICRVPAKMADSFNSWKASTQAKYYTLLLRSGDPGDLARVSDRTWCLRNLSIEEGAIQELMSI
jgi:uncharacterized protein with von Willebrand factor type A (vWA) domain